MINGNDPNVNINFIVDKSENWLNHFPHGFTNVFLFEKFNARISKSRHSFYFEILEDYTPRHKNAQKRKTHGPYLRLQCKEEI